MVFFYITLFPLTFLLISSLLYKGSLKEKEAWENYFFGVLVAVPVFLLLLEFKGTPVPEEFSMKRLYLHGFWNDNLLLLIFPVFFYGILSLFVPRYSIRSEATDPFFPAMAFFFGFYTLITANDLLVYPFLNEFYILFILPVLRFSVVISVSLCFSTFGKLIGFKRYILLGITILAIFFAPVGTMVYRLHYLGMTFIICAVLIIWDILALFLFSREN